MVAQGVVEFPEAPAGKSEQQQGHQQDGHGKRQCVGVEPEHRSVQFVEPGATVQIPNGGPQRQHAAAQPNHLNGRAFFSEANKQYRDSSNEKYK